MLSSHSIHYWNGIVAACMFPGQVNGRSVDKPFMHNLRWSGFSGQGPSLTCEAGHCP